MGIRTATAGVAACMLLFSAPVTAQSIHLPPMYRHDLPQGTPVLVISRVQTTTLPADAEFVADGDNLVVFHNSLVDRVTLKDRTMGDLAGELKTRYAVTASTDYPAAPARLLGKSGTAYRFVGQTATLKAGAQDPTAQLGFGVVMGLGPADRPAGSGLLSQTGFQLDVTGTHQLKPHRERDERTGSWRAKAYGGTQIFTQVRLGLSSDQPLVVGQDTSSSGAGNQFQAAVEQADQISLTGQFDLVWPIQSRTEFGLSLGYALNYTQPEELQLPTLIVRDTARSLSAVFGEDRASAVSRRLNGVAALSDFSALLVFRFHTADKLAYYAGGGVMSREILVRGIQYRRLDGDIDTTSLRATLDGQAHRFWQAVFGVDIPNIINIRVDGVGAVDRNFDRPVLRLVIGREFPVAGKKD